MSLQEKLEQLMSQENINSFEGHRGVRNLQRIVHTLDSNYNSLEAFFSDNPGAIEAVIDFINNARVPEWVANIDNVLIEPVSDDDDQQDE